MPGRVVIVTRIAPRLAVMKKIIRLPDVDPAKAAQLLLNGVDGFVTDTGRFIDRSEAFQVAAKSRQMSDHEYADPEKNKAFYGTDKPSLDSGLIEHWAELLRHPACLH